MVEISQLLEFFSSKVLDQQKDIDSIYDAAVTSHEHINKVCLARGLVSFACGIGGVGCLGCEPCWQVARDTLRRGVRFRATPACACIEGSRTHAHLALKPMARNATRRATQRNAHPSTGVACSVCLPSLRRAGQRAPGGGDAAFGQLPRLRAAVPDHRFGVAAVPRLVVLMIGAATLTK